MKLNEAEAIAMAKGLRSSTISDIKFQNQANPATARLEDFAVADAKTVRAILSVVDVAEDASPRQILDAAWAAAKAEYGEDVPSSIQLRLAAAEMKLG